MKLLDKIYSRRRHCVRFKYSLVFLAIAIALFILLGLGLTVLNYSPLLCLGLALLASAFLTIFIYPLL